VVWLIAILMCQHISRNFKPTELIKMRQVVTVICMLLFFIQQSFAQLPAKPANELEALLQQNISGEMRVQTLLQLTLYYYFEQYESRKNLDKMYGYLLQAQQVNNTIHSSKWQNELDCYFGKYFLKIGNPKKANEYFEKVSCNVANSGSFSRQVENWRRFAGSIRALDTTGLTRNDCFLKLRELYDQVSDREKVIEMEKAIADTHLKQGKLDIAETELLSVLDKYKSIGYKRLHYTYNLLSSVNWFKGNYNTALY
jgi:tetratricopeptide (TPR) repeat protein